MPKKLNDSSSRAVPRRSRRLQQTSSRQGVVHQSSSSVPTLRAAPNVANTRHENSSTNFAPSPAIQTSKSTSRKKKRSGRTQAPRKRLQVSTTESLPQITTSAAKDNVQLQKTSTVTPSPANRTIRTETESDASSKSSSLSAGSSLMTSKKHKQDVQREVVKLPNGVINMYPRNFGEKYCGCRFNHCSPETTTAKFLSDYGSEYLASLKSREQSMLLSTTADDAASVGSDIASCTTLSLASTNSAGSSITCYNYKLQDTKHELNYMERQPHLSPKMRAILVDWLIELTQEYKLEPATLFLAVTLVDQSLSKAPPEATSPCSPGSNASTVDRSFVVEREMLQCLGCACMWIACKIEETEPPAVEDFVYISDNSYTRQQITDLEMTVCSALKFRLWHITPVQYAHEFCRASQALYPESLGCNNPLLEHMVMYLLELSLLPYSCVMREPSLIAAAAVYLARATLGLEEYWNETLKFYSGYNMYDLEDTVYILHRYQTNAEQAELNTIFKKYKSSKYHSVSLKTVRHVEDLGF